MHIEYFNVAEDMPGIIEKRGRDFVYEAPPGSGGVCQYVWKGAPSCMIGVYLVDLGLPLEAFQSVSAMDVHDLFADGRLDEWDFTAAPEAIRAMGQLQQLQDDGYAWGDAYDRTFDIE